MPMKKYLYGAAVQGIQQFIFQSTELAEIAEASAIVDAICKSFFAECLYGRPVDEEQMLQDYKDHLIVNAAGNVKVILNEDDCRRVCLTFRKMISDLVPGITVSQAVVPLPDNGQLNGELIDKLEQKLRIQRNMIPRNAALGMMGTLRCRKTGLPAVAWSKDEAVDKATLTKHEGKKGGRGVRDLCNMAFGSQFRSNQLPYNIEDIEGIQKWVAIIHADGNGLGQVVRRVGHDTEKFPVFSRRLDQATRNSVRDTFNELVGAGKIVMEKDGKPQVLPIRPVVLGGDDVTVICRADLAMDFVNILCRKFEEQTKDLLGDIIGNNVFESGENYLTLCAGIAFIKSNYPFHFGYHLAEELCSVAKKDARSQVKDENTCLIPACAAFHKIQDSFVESYSDICVRELSLSGSRSFMNGPYYVSETSNRDTIDSVVKSAKRLLGADKIVKNALRQWLSDMALDHVDEAQQRLDRMYAIKQGKETFIQKLTTGSQRIRKVGGEEQRIIIYPAYDVMSLSAVYKPE